MQEKSVKPKQAKETNSLWSLFALIAAIVLFSTVEISSKNIAEKSSIDPFMMVFLRFFVTGIVLLSFSLVPYLRKNGAFKKEDWKNFLLNGFLGITVSLSFFHAAIAMFANASSSAVVFSANAVFAIVIARFMNNEAWTKQKWAALILALIGISLFIFEKGTPGLDTVKALLVMSLAALGFAFSVCLTRKVVNKYGATLFMGMSALIGSIFITPLAFRSGQIQSLTEIGPAWGDLIYIVLLGTTVAYLLYYMGLKKISAFIASMIFFMKPPLACLLAWIIRGEKMNWWTITGTIVVFASLFLTIMKRRK